MTATASMLDKIVLPSRRTKTSPLTYFAIPLGLAGLGGAWLGAHQHLGAPAWPAEILYALSSAAWLTFTGVYVARGFRPLASFQDDLRDSSTGPMTAFIPAVAILLSSHYASYFPVFGSWVTVFFVAALFLVAAQLVGHWFAAGIGVDSLHGGFFIPVVAGPFIASIGLTTVGFHQGAILVWGAGLFFWLSFGTILMGRQMTGSPLPKPATPTLAAFLAAPASGGVAWTLSHPGPIDEVEYLLLGILLTMLLIQVILIGHYRKLSFSFQFWIFTFPAATTANFIIRWVAQAHYPGWQVYSWVALGLATGFIASIGAGTIRLMFRNDAHVASAVRRASGNRGTVRSWQ